MLAASKLKQQCDNNEDAKQGNLDKQSRDDHVLAGRQLLAIASTRNTASNAMDGKTQDVLCNEGLSQSRSSKQGKAFAVG